MLKYAYLFLEVKIVETVFCGLYTYFNVIFYKSLIGYVSYNAYTMMLTMKVLIIQYTVYFVFVI